MYRDEKLCPFFVGEGNGYAGHCKDWCPLHRDGGCALSALPDIAEALVCMVSTQRLIAGRLCKPWGRRDSEG